MHGKCHPHRQEILRESTVNALSSHACTRVVIVLLADPRVLQLVMGAISFFNPVCA